jgi:hypothetical protein
MKWLFRPIGLILLSLLLVVMAALIVLYPDFILGRPRAAQVPPGYREIAWLYPATSGNAWEQLIKAIKRAAESDDLRVEETRLPGDLLPEIILHAPGQPLLFRWYKLTSDTTADHWCQQLLQRDPPPLAVLSGSTTNMARQVAMALNNHGVNLPQEDRPLLLLTTATADSSDSAEDFDQAHSIKLESLYPERTFRACFTNRQMARALTRFIWSKPELKPDRGPVWTALWLDDGYSRDLYKGYQAELEERKRESEWQLLRLALQPDPTGKLVLSALPLWPVNSDLPTPLRVESSVGTFNAANTYEARGVQLLMQWFRQADEMELPPARPLLVVTGQTNPTRRFIREVARWDPNLARRFVVTTGDAISFDHVYRDRRITWPVQDLPVMLVFFSHRNPVDARAGFQPESRDAPRGSASSTALLRLYEDIVHALLLTTAQVENAQQLCDAFLLIRFDKGKLSMGAEGGLLFGPDGRRNSGTGEHVVWVRPRLLADQSLPAAQIEIWRQESAGGWVSVGEPLVVSYRDQEYPDDEP